MGRSNKPKGPLAFLPITHLSAHLETRLAKTHPFAAQLETDCSAVLTRDGATPAATPAATAASSVLEPLPGA